ncbi:MAG: GNAT family N-acetyltransferase [Salibacteraceae bacterium]
MAPFSSPILLGGPKRLAEIFALRTLAWERSPGRQQINSSKYPNGYSDCLDANSLHFVSTDWNGNIIAAARLSVCNSYADLPYPEMFAQLLHLLPQQRPFAFYSRLVIHPDYRKRGIAQAMDTMRMEKQQELQLPFGLVTVNAKRCLKIQPYGFVRLGYTPKPEGDAPFEPLALMRLNLEEIRLPQQLLLDAVV